MLIPAHSVDPSAQIGGICCWKILEREANTRAFYKMVRDLGVEQQRCESVLGLLLPPSLVTTMQSNIALRAPAGSPDASFHSSASGGSRSTGRRGSASLDVISTGGERFAEAFADASVLFAEGASAGA